MKKFYLLSLLFCVSLFAFGQTTTVTIYASGISGAFITGNATSTGVRTDGNIIANGAGIATRGYAVFNIASAAIPAGSVIGSVIIGYNVSSYSGGTITCSTNLYNGDLSTVTAGATLYTDMQTPAATNISTVAYSGSTGIQTVASTIAGVNFVQAHYAGTISASFVNSGTSSFTITGETGTLTTTGTHAPYIQITYCAPPTLVTGTATPTTICAGDTLSLTGAATGASGGYSWTGPGGYSVGVLSTTMNTPSTGVYTFTATRSCATYSATATAYSAPITVNPIPFPIAGSSFVCTGGNTTLSDGSLLGTWSSSTTSIASIDPSLGTVTGNAAGTSTISYTISSTGCFNTFVITDNDPPGTISGPVEVCQASTITLIEGSSGGGWTTTAGSGSAGIGGTGIVTGTTAGTATVSYTISGCVPATYPITIDPLPSAISGTLAVCETFTTTLTNPGSGTWSSSNVSVASIVSGTGNVTGVAAGTAAITFMLNVTGCITSKIFTVNPTPAMISGPANVCPNGHGANPVYTDASGFGSWSSSNTAVGSIVPFGFGSGTFTGISTGITIITFTKFGTGCYNITPVAVYPIPASNTGLSSFCQGMTSTLNNTDGTGIWISQNSALATVGSTTGVVTGVSSAAVWITYLEPDGCYSNTDVSVLPIPVSVITASGPTTFCTGGSVTLTATGGAGLTYQWYDGGSPLIGATTSTYVVNTSGNYTVDITNFANCTTTSAGTYVTAGLNPTITSSNPSSSFCVGNSTVLTANTGGIVGALTFQWAKNGTTIPSATLPTYYVNSTGDYTCSVTVSGGSGICIAVTPGYNAVVNPLPTPTITFNGLSFVTATSYTTYQWYLNTVSIHGATNYKWTPIENGVYDVVVKDANGCTGYSNSIPYTGYINAGVASVNNPGIQVYPNPATSELNIQSPIWVRAVITGVEGKVYLEKADAKNINIGSLANGLYIIMLYDEKDERVMVQKIIKE